MSQSTGATSTRKERSPETPLVRVPSRAMHPSSFPLMERPAAALMLAFNAGMLNAWTFSHAQIFATVQSGNVVQIGYQLVAGNWDKFFYALGTLLSFGFGSFMAGAFIAAAMRRNRRYSPPLQGALIVALAIAVVLVATEAWPPHYIAWVISFAAGMQGNGFHKLKGMTYGNIAVTVVAQLAFNYLVQSFYTRTGPDGTSNLRTAGLYFSVLFAFSCGGAAGFGLDVLWSGLSIVGAIVITAILMVATIKSKTDPDAV